MNEEIDEKENSEIPNYDWWLLIFSVIFRFGEPQWYKYDYNEGEEEYDRENR